MNVTIRECKSNGREWTHRARTQDRQEAINRTVRRHFGRRAWFWQDSGLPAGYGQVCEPVGQMQHTCLTDRVRITVQEVQ